MRNTVLLQKAIVYSGEVVYEFFKQRWQNAALNNVKSTPSIDPVLLNLRIFLKPYLMQRWSEKRFYPVCAPGSVKYSTALDGFQTIYLAVADAWRVGIRLKIAKLVEMVNVKMTLTSNLERWAFNT